MNRVRASAQSGKLLCRSFDFVIVGAGSAGCVLANRLTRNPNVRVLLLEAGGWDWHPLISVPLATGKLFQDGTYDWGDVSEPDPGLDGRCMAVPHGKVVGGTSSINNMAHTRGHPADYERWVAQGATGWGYSDLLPIFKECERWHLGEDDWRGGNGEHGVQEIKSEDPLHEASLKAIRSQGYKITSDFNGEQPEGFGAGQFSVRDGRRCSTARAFLRPALNRSNLTVLTHATVTKVVFEGRTAVGVEYAWKGRRSTVQSAARVVLCLGSINTPHLLMLSGIGPADHLRTMGIQPIVNLPVGKSLEDHLGVLLQWTRKRPGPFHSSLRLDRVAVNMLRAYLLRSGPATRLPGIINGFVKSKPNASQPDLKMVLYMFPSNVNFWFPSIKRAYEDGFGIRVHLLNQESRGEVLLRSANPNDRPRIFYNSLSAPGDIETLRNGVKLAWNIGTSPFLSEFRQALDIPRRKFVDDREIDAFIRNTALQLYHPASTCRMGNDEASVVDSNLNVLGVKALSIVDASAMPNLVSANPNVTVIVMAAKAARMWTRSKPDAARDCRLSPLGEGVTVQEL